MEWRKSINGTATPNCECPKHLGHFLRLRSVKNELVAFADLRDLTRRES